MVEFFWLAPSTILCAILPFPLTPKGQSDPRKGRFGKTA